MSSTARIIANKRFMSSMRGGASASVSRQNGYEEAAGVAESVVASTVEATVGGQPLCLARTDFL